MTNKIARDKSPSPLAIPHQTFHSISRSVHSAAAGFIRLAVIILIGLSVGPLPAAQSETFEQMAQASVKALEGDKSFHGFDTDIFVARPFVIMMTRDANADKKALMERKLRLSSLAQGIWRNWLKVRADWQLKSTRNDTLEQPEPFVWISFHDAAAYDRYMKEFQTKSTPGAQAFYSTETHYTYTREATQHDPSIILIHETFHQLMDRFSKTSSTGYQNYCFTEGVPEFFAGYRGEGESLMLGQFNRTRRADQIRRIHTYFDARQKVIYPLHENKMQITPDDWILFDVPLLLTLRDKMWTTAIDDAMIKGFQRSNYMSRKECKDYIEDGAANLHAAFYAFSWAFNYWLREKHPEEHDRYAQIVLNTDRGGDAETFLEAFKIQPTRPLPDILALVGPNNRDVQKNMQKAVKCLDQRIAILRQTPAIQDMHREWAEWMRTTFPKLASVPDDELSRKSPTNQSKEITVKARPLTALAEDRQAAIDRVIIKGDAPMLIYVPIIHDSEFSRLSNNDGGVPDIMKRCETIADHLYQNYGVRNILLEGLGKKFVDQYNRVPVERRHAPGDNKDVLLVHNTWLRLLAEKQWLLLPAADQPIVGPLTALGREYDPRTVAILNEAKQNGWFRNLEVFTANQKILQERFQTLATEYNAKHRALLAEDPDLKREYDITVTQRNKEFLDRLLAPATPGLVFFGAAHWQDIEEQLTKRGTSYAVVVPKGIAWPPTPKDAATIKADMLNLGAQLKKTSLTLGDGKRIDLTIPIE